MPPGPEVAVDGGPDWGPVLTGAGMMAGAQVTSRQLEHGEGGGHRSGC